MDRAGKGDTAKTRRGAEAAQRREVAEEKRLARDARYEPIRASARARLSQLPQAPARTAAELRRVKLIEKAISDAKRAALAKRWSHKNEGTPETHERFNAQPDRVRRVAGSPLHRMEALGTITSDERAAAEEIASIVEMIERSVSIRSASLEARVDNSGSARDALIESLGRIRLEVAYRAWRQAIPQPRRMILDMILTNVPYVRLAKSYRMHWRTARKRLITALRMWPEFRMLARHSVDEADVQEVYARLGDGVLLAPRPKAEARGEVA